MFLLKKKSSLMKHFIRSLKKRLQQLDCWWGPLGLQSSTNEYSSMEFFFSKFRTLKLIKLEILLCKQSDIVLVVTEIHCKLEFLKDNGDTGGVHVHNHYWFLKSFQELHCYNWWNYYASIPTSCRLHLFDP